MPIVAALRAAVESAAGLIRSRLRGCPDTGRRHCDSRLSRGIAVPASVTPMGYIKQILVIVDPTAAEHPAVDKAALLAEKFKARLELFACDTKAAREMRLSSHVRDNPGAPLPVEFQRRARIFGRTAACPRSGRYDRHCLRRSAACRIDRSDSTYERRSGGEGHPSSFARSANVSYQHGLAVDSRLVPCRCC